MKHPDLRLGQLFMDFYVYYKRKGIDMFTIEDEELLNELEKLYEKFEFVEK